MTCFVKVSIISESVTGDIGDDWEYSVEARVYNPSLQSAGTIRVDEHTLKPGTTQPPPQNRALDLPAGDCGTAPRVQLIVRAKEVDWLIDDKGSDELSLLIECPGPGGPPTTLEPEIPIRVKEAPSLLGGQATFKVKVRLVARCS